MDDRLGTRTVHNRKLGKQNMMRDLGQYFTLQDHDANVRRRLLLKIVLCYEDEDCDGWMSCTPSSKRTEKDWKVLCIKLVMTMMIVTLSDFVEDNGLLVFE